MTAGFVLYVADLTPMKDFYCGCFDLAVREQDESYVALENGHFELILLMNEISRSFKNPANTTADSTVQKRELTPIKPTFFSQEAMDIIRQKVLSHGGGFNAKESEWTFNQHHVCDGWDVEGNIFQVRSPAPS